MKLEEIEERHLERLRFDNYYCGSLTYEDIESLISEVKRLRGAIESVINQKDLISYAIEKELREALEEGEQRP